MTSGLGPAAGIAGALFKNMLGLARKQKIKKLEDRIKKLEAVIKKLESTISKAKEVHAQNYADHEELLEHSRTMDEEYTILYRRYVALQNKHFKTDISVAEIEENPYE